MGLAFTPGRLSVALSALEATSALTSFQLTPHGVAVIGAASFPVDRHSRVDEWYRTDLGPKNRLNDH